MPHVQVTLLQGRNTDQKRKLVTRITDALVEECNARREAVTVAIVEVPKEHFGSGGVLIADKK
jgi:4-oxalocrotonate tautomerase